MNSESRLVGLDGEPLSGTDDLSPEPEILTDEQAEIAGEKATDVSSTDELGIPYFYPMDHPNEALRGKRMSPQDRRHLRKLVKDRIKKDRAFWRSAVPRGELQNMFDTMVVPLQKQLQSVTFLVLALKQLIVDRGIATNDELNALVNAHFAEFREKALEKVAKEQGWTPEQLAEQKERVRRLAAERAAKKEQQTPAEGVPA